MALVLVFLAPAALAKPKGGKLEGTVTGLGSGTLGNVHVYLMADADHPALQDALTDYAGRFSFVRVREGTYTIHLVLAGWKDKFLDGVEVRGGGTSSLFIAMDPDVPSSLLPAVEPQLWNRSNWWGSYLGDVAINQMPTSRTVWSLLENQSMSTVTQTLDTSQLETGTPSLFGAHGASWTENQYIFNGFNATDPYVTGKALVDPDYATLTSVTDVIGAKPPNFGRAGNNVLLGIRQPQSNLHGQAGLFFSTRALQSDNLTPDLVKVGFPGPERMNSLYDANAQMGADLPFGKVTWPFFVAFSTQQLSKDLGGFAAPIDAHANHILAELTPYQHEGQSVNLLYAGEQEFNNHDGAAINTAVDATQRRNDNFQQFQGIWRDVLNPSSVIAAGFGVTHANLSSGFATGPLSTSTLDYPNSILSGSTPLAQYGQRTIYETNVMFQTVRDHLLGSHGLMVGATMDVNTMSNHWQAVNGMQQITVNGVGAQVIQWNTPAQVHIDTQDFAVFVQDAWRPTRWIAFPLGLRLVHSAGKAEDVNNRISWTTLEPRAGVVFPVPHVPALVLRAGWARYGHELQGQYLNYGNPSALGGTISAWDDANHDGQVQPSEIGNVQRVFGGATTGIAPGLARPYTDEISVGLEAHAGKFYQVRVRGFRRDDHRLVEAVNTGVPLTDYTPVVVSDPILGALPSEAAYSTVTVFNQNPATLGQDFATLGNPGGYGSRAKGVDVEMTFRSGRHFEVTGEFTAMATSARTNVSNSVYSNDTGVLNPFGNDPNSAVNNLGITYFDRGKYGKLSALYNFPLGIHVAGIVRYLDGLVYTPLLFVNGLNQGPIFVMAAPRDDYTGFRTHFNSTFDLRVSRRFGLPHGALDVDLDIFNMLNQNQNTQEQDVVSPTLLVRIPLAIQAPRTARLGVQWTF